MKIAVFHEVMPGGARKVINEMALRLKKSHVVDLYTTSPFFQQDDKKYFSNIKIYEFKMGRKKGWFGRLYKDSLELYKLSKIHKKIAEDIRKKNYDIFWVNASQLLEAPFVLKYKNKNKIFYCHDPNYRMIYESILGIPSNIGLLKSTYEKANREIRKFLDKINIKNADLLIASSNYEKRVIKKTYGLDSKVVYYGVNFNFFSPKREKKEYDVLYLGTSHILEGYSTLLEILKYLPKSVRLKIVLGDKKRINSKFDLLKTYRKSKIVLALGYNEPFGLTPLEAASCQVPVIAVSEGAYPETVKNGKTGIIIKRDAKKIASQIIKLLENQSLLKKLGENARENVIRNWGWDINIKKLNKIFTWQAEK